MTIFDYMHAHMIIGVLLFLWVTQLTFFTVRRFMRYAIVLMCGWSPEHLDIDGRHGGDY